MFRLSLFGLALLTSTSHAADAWHLYVGTYTGKQSKGIYLFEMDTKTGKLTEKGLAAETPNPSFVAIHPSMKYLYAVSEIANFDGKKAGAVAAFAIEKDGKLTLLNKQSSGGGGPCHLVTDKAGKFVLVANYGGGSVSSIPINADGKLGEPASFHQHTGSSVDKARQKEPHAHSINLDAKNNFAMAADLGLDKVLVYRFDQSSGKLTPTGAPGVVAPGSGPRHFAFHPTAPYAFVINEMKLTLTSFKYDADKGTLTEVETLSTLPKNVTDLKGMSTAEVVVHPNGKLVFGSNRGHNSIAIFKFDPEKGKLTYVTNEGSNIATPRNFIVDPTGQFLLVANQSGNSITVFKIDTESGHLTQVGQPVPVPAPVCLRMMPVK